MADGGYRVRAVACDPRADDEEVYRALGRATAPLTATWQQLARARRVVIKFNMIETTVEYFGGRRRELVDDAVARAVLRLLRERTDATLTALDTYPYGNGNRVPAAFNYRYLLEAYGVGMVDASLPPLVGCEVPGGGCMFARYRLPAALVEADAVVSVAKMKNHLFTGVTLCTKNLFGLPPMIPPTGRPRAYFHHLVRLPYVLADLAMVARPCLNIIDGLVGQWGREWRGQGRLAGTLVAGDHPIATDTCATMLMGADPASDWPTPPFRRDRNHLRLAAERGFGPRQVTAVDFASEVQAPVADFDAEPLDPEQTVASWRYTACEQGLYYRDHQAELVDRYAGQYIYLQDDEVVWAGDDPNQLGSRRHLSGDRHDRALWLKWVDPEEWEGERFSVYEECLRQRDAGP